MSYQDFDKELEDRRKQEEDEQVTGWNAVEIDETPVNITVSNPCTSIRGIDFWTFDDTLEFTTP